MSAGRTQIFLQTPSFPVTTVIAVSFAAGPPANQRVRYDLIPNQFPERHTGAWCPVTSMRKLRQGSIFGGLTACSANTFSIYILLTTQLQPRFHVLAGMGRDELRLPTPVRPGDELDLESIVLEKRESKSKSERGIVRNQIRLRNQRSEIVLQCISNILVARRPGP